MGKPHPIELRERVVAFVNEAIPPLNRIASEMAPMGSQMPL